MIALRRAVAFTALLLVWPAMALAQAPRAGVVTTLEGNVTATRVALPRPVPLKFRDDVFLRDRIVTGDRSLARLLLGDRAIVTVRERSSLTVTEIPGRSTVDLDSGKVGLGVARNRMRPGEVIDIRTPNAIVAVRGTVAVVEVNRVTTQVGGPPPPVTSSIYLLRGTAEATRLNPATGAPIGTPFPLGPLTSFRVTGVGAPVIGPIPPGQVAQIVAGLRASRPEHREAANKDQIKEQVIAATTGVLNAVTDENVVPPPLSSAIAMALDPTPEIVVPITPVDQGTASNITNVLSRPLRPDIVIIGILFLDPGLTLNTFSGETTRTGAVQFVQIGDTSVTLAVADLPLLLGATPQDLATLQASGATVVAQLGTDNFLEIAPGAVVDLVNRLVTVSNAIVVAGGNFLRVDGTLSVSGPGGIMFFDPSAVQSMSDFLYVGPTGRVTVAAGPAIGALQSSLVALGHLVNVDGGRIDGGAATLLSFQQSAVEAHGHLAHVQNGGVVSLGGPLVVASNTTLGPAGNPPDPPPVVDILRVVNGATLTSITPEALIQLANVVVNTSERLLTVAGNSTVALTGGVLNAVGGQMNFGNGLIAVQGGQLVVGPGDAVATISGGSHFIGTLLRAQAPALAFQGLATQDIVADGNLLTVGTDQPIQTARTLLDVVGATVATGPLAGLDTMLFNATAPIFTGRAGASVTATTGIELANRVAMMTSAPVLMLRDFSSFTVSAGNILVVNNSVLNVKGDLFSLVNGSVLNATSAAPGQLLQGALVRVANGGVLNVTGGLINFGGPAVNTVNLTNGFCPGGDCGEFNGIRVHCTTGCSGNVTIGGTPIKNPALGQFNIPDDVHIIVDGPTAKVTIVGGN